MYQTTKNNLSIALFSNAPLKVWRKGNVENSLLIPNVLSVELESGCGKSFNVKYHEKATWAEKWVCVQTID